MSVLLTAIEHVTDMQCYSVTIERVTESVTDSVLSKDAREVH